MFPGARILIIDDEQPIRSACAKILRAEGAFCETAENGVIGLEKARSGSFDLALIDLRMPRMGGMELLSRLGETDPDLVKIVITGIAALETAVEAVQKGAYDYLPKPFTPGELRTRVGRGLEKRALACEARRLAEERARNLLELANEKSRTQTIIRCMADGLLVTNRDRRVVFWNPAGLRLLRIPGTSAEGQSVPEAVPHPDFPALVEEAMALAESQSMVSRELPPPTPQDPTLMAHCAPVKDERGQIIGTVTVLRDITQMKELDKAKSAFVSLVAHELRAPLAAVEGYLDLLLEGVGAEDPEKTRKILERSRDRTRGLLTLIDDLLALSRMQASRLVREKERLPVGPLLREAEELMQGEARQRGISLEVDFPENLPPVLANREDLRRVFTNLLDNALKYNRAGGKVAVRALERAGHVAVEIRDTGIGISGGDLERIFGEFYRVKSKETRKISGTGLGLAIAKKIVEDHRGGIEVESEPQRGSLFRVLLPVAAE
jgi:two-component system, OmpR family, phosphate regulon sensor histidine kinase PhoR